MSIIKNRAPRFVTVPSETVRDPDLSGDLLGLLVFLLDFPSDWNVSISWLVAQHKFGANSKVCNDLKRLRSLGYARLTKHNDGTTEWDITSTKGVFEPDSGNRNEGPDSQNRNLRKCDSHIPETGMHTHKGINTEGKKENTEGNPLPDADAPAPEQVKPAKSRKGKGKDEPAKSAATWEAYRTAYMARHGLEPIRNAKVNAQLSGFVDRVGADLAPEAARFYVQMGGYYLSRKHPVDLMVKDAETIGAECQAWISSGKKGSPPSNPADARREAARAMLFGGNERVIQGEVIR